MNQKEYMASIQKEIKHYEEELALVQNDRQKRFASQMARLESIRELEDIIDKSYDKIKHDLAKRISSTPELYMEGSSHRLAKNIIDGICKACPGVGDEVFDVVWHEYHEEVDRATKELRTKQEKLTRESWAIKSGELGKLFEKESKLQDKISSSRSHLAHVSQVSNFRQFAKDHKEQMARQAIRDKAEDAKNQAAAWVREHIFKGAV